MSKKLCLILRFFILLNEEHFLLPHAWFSEPYSSNFLIDQRTDNHLKPIADSGRWSTLAILYKVARRGIEFEEKKRLKEG